ncbi:ANTAR domain-containing response regulator [Candidatus Poriferisocius sp.]|uniref:ANTAR domain-containing response regulator n=1 Tax=Candidatus Poriferisocius sp. TaxID=3101276 RepID=UPI003B5BBFF2
MPEVTAAPSSEAGETAATDPVRIVLAEDEAIIRLDLRETLEEEGYQVVGETSRGDQVLDLVREKRPDVAILDVKMPGTDGITVAGQIRDEKLCAVLLLTAFSQRDLITRAADAGALAYLVKPFERAELVPAVEVALVRFRELVELNHQVARAEARLEARKVIDRAKGRLMDLSAMSEADAYRYLQHQAMSGRRSMADVAAEIIEADAHRLRALQGEQADG